MRNFIRVGSVFFANLLLAFVVAGVRRKLLSVVLSVAWQWLVFVV